MSTPAWLLSVFYWLHMLATVAWIGSLVALGILVLPAAKRILDEQAYARFLQELQRRLDPLAWLSLAVLAATGLFQMSANPNYQGFLTISNRWAAAILAKHILFLAMVAVSGYLTWVVLPGMRRVAIQRARGQSPAQAESLERREVWLMRLNLILGVLILGLTAVARAA